MQKFLAGIDYPVSRDGVVEHAQQHGADENVLQYLRRMPDRDYDGPNAVSKAFAEAG